MTRTAVLLQKSIEHENQKLLAEALRHLRNMVNEHTGIAEADGFGSPEFEEEYDEALKFLKENNA